MRTLSRNMRTFYYCLLIKVEAQTSGGLETGELMPTYTAAQGARGNISAVSGFAQMEQFGVDAHYDKVIVMDDLDVANNINEDTVLFVDKTPEYDQQTGLPLYDYVVKRVAISLNSATIAISKVKIR